MNLRCLRNTVNTENTMEATTESSINQQPLLGGGYPPIDPNKGKSLWKWLFAVLALALVAITTGSPNLYPTQRDDIKELLGLSDGMTTFLLSGGVMLLYITLPAGLFMDKFGADITFLISAIICVAGYASLPFCYTKPWLFVTMYFVMAFGSASLFIVCLQIVLSRAPAQIKGFSTSCVSAALSLSFGLFLEVFKGGKTALKCIGNSCVVSGFQMVSISVCVIVVIAAPIAYFCYKGFRQGGNQPSSKAWWLLLSPKLYVMLITNYMCVYDGMLVIQCGDIVWKRYGSGYPEAAGTWGTIFSITNCVCTIILSAILDVILHKLQSVRQRWFSFFWIAMGFIPAIVAVLFKTTDNEALFGVFTSMMGIPFGFGLTHIPAIVSDLFGNDKYGFAYGVVQAGAIIASASTMAILEAVENTGTLMAFIISAVLHVVISLIILLFVRPDSRQPGLGDESSLNERLVYD